MPNSPRNLRIFMLSLLAALQAGNATADPGFNSWTLPKDEGLTANPGCFAALTCSDRIALSRISAALQNESPKNSRSAIQNEMKSLPGAQRARILRAVLTGTNVLPSASFTELNPTDQSNITFIEVMPGISILIQDVRKAADALAQEARAIRDASLASHLWMIVTDGAEAGISRLLGTQPRGIPLVERAEDYRTAVAALDDRVRSSLLDRRLPAETIEELRGSYQKRMNQLSEQLVLEIEQASAAIAQSQGTALVPLELIAEAGMMVASSGASSIAVRSSMQVAAISGFSATAWNAGRAAHAAFASNDTNFFCELSENSLSNPAIVSAAIGGISGGFLGKLVTAQSAGVRAFGGAVGMASVAGVTTAVELGRWNDAETALALAEEARKAGRIEEASCFLQARDQQLAGIAIDLTTLAAGTFTGASRKPTQGELRAAEQSRIASERLKTQIATPSGGSPRPQDPLDPQFQAQTASNSASIFRKDKALREALDGMKKVDDLLDLSAWDRLWIRAEARETGDTMTLTLFNRLTSGRVSIDIHKADAAAAERAVSRRQVDAIYDALTLGERIHLEL